MLKAMNKRMAESAHRGTFIAKGAATRIMTKRVRLWIMPAIGVTAPLLMLVTVRAMVPVDGRPPKKGTMQFAMPCPISS